MNSIKSALLWIFIILTPIQDSDLQASPLRFMGASPSFIPLIVLLGISFLTVTIKHTITKKFLYAISLYLFLTLLTSVYSIVYFSGNLSTSLMLYKVMSNLILYSLAFYAIFGIRYTDNILWPVLFAFTICIFGLISTNLLHLLSFSYKSFFHYTENMNLRPRGFSMEASDFGATIGTLGLLVAYYLKSYIRMLIIILTTGVIFYTSSKGSDVAWILAVASIPLFLFFHKRNFTYLLLSIFGGIIVAGGYVYTKGLLAMALPTSTIPTRLTMALSALYTITTSPLGVGFSGVIPSFREAIPTVVHFLRDAGLNNSDYSEVLGYLNDPTGKDISGKSFFFTMAIISGIPFILFYFWFNATVVLRIWKTLEDPYLFALTVYLCIALTTYVGLLNIYCLSVGYGVLYEKCIRSYSDCNTRLSISSESWRKGRYPIPNRSA
jgi:hypothetical protein